MPTRRRGKIVTILFTDIEGSTRQGELTPAAMGVAVKHHNDILRQFITKYHGVVLKIVGDNFQASFDDPEAALVAAVSVQRALTAEPWEQLGVSDVRVRMALHTGSLTWDKTKRDYEWAPMLNHVARLMAAANGGQILLSRATAELVRGALPEGIRLHDHGEHRLKDIKQPMQVYQVLVAGLLTDERSLKTLDVPRHNLPVQPTKFLGREKEVGDVVRLLEDGEKKLVTLIGPGGVGKTRLGLQIAASFIDSFDRVVFVDLAPLRDPNLVAGTIARTLELRETTGERLLDDIIYYLRDKHLFLLLANFEYVVSASTIVDELLAACPRLTVLVTSLCALGLRREQRYQVLPFPVHDLGCQIVRTDASKSTAICLFMQRARAVDPSFELTAVNVQWVANICWRLDGLPLAIELAASRIDVFPPQALYGKLKSLLSMLKGGASDAPERQQTMRGTIEWSCKLLAPTERDLLWRLAVFAGGCTIETITAVCYPLTVQLRSEPDIVESITSLVNKSLLRRDNIRRPTNENPRFTMLQTIREYGLEQLKASGEALPLQEQHALYFAHLVEQEEPRFVDADQEVWLDGIDAEQENIREALTWACESNKADIGLRMAGTLWWFWYVRGSRTEGRDWLKQLFLLMKNNHHSVPPLIEARARYGAGQLAYVQTDYEVAVELYRESLALYQSSNDKQGIALSLSGLGNVAEERCEYSHAQELHEESLALYRELNDQRGIATELIYLGNALKVTNDYDRIAALREESLTLRRALKDKRGIASSLYNVALSAEVKRDYERAVALHNESLAYWSQVKVPSHMSSTRISGATGVKRSVAPGT